MTSSVVGSSAAGASHERFSSSIADERLGKKSRIGANPYSCSTMRWIVMSSTRYCERILRSQTGDLRDATSDLLSLIDAWYRRDMREANADRRRKRCRRRYLQNTWLRSTQHVMEESDMRPRSKRCVQLAVLT